MEKLHELKLPFKEDEIEWRVQTAFQTRNGKQAIVVPYVTNRAIMDRLDAVIGPDGWKNEYIRWGEKGVLCGISIKIGDEWVTKFDGAEDTNIESVKGGISGAQKRAAVQWGIGRYLYSLDTFRVTINNNGQNYVKQKMKNGQFIEGYWNTPALPNWALPEGHTSSNQTRQQTPPVQQATQPNTQDNKNQVSENAIHYIKGCEQFLGLEEAEKTVIFKHVTGHAVKTVEEIYRSGEDLLSQYLMAIKVPAHLKELVDKSGVNEQEILADLNDKFDHNVTSWRSLINKANVKTFNYVKKRIEQSQSQSTQVS